MNNADFRERIRASLANETLQIALDLNAERRVNGRIAAFATLPNWREKRQQANTVRADIIEHLDTYLEQFIEKVEQNGIIVHRASDAAGAIRIVLELVESNVSERWTEDKTDDGSRWTPLVAKSKSMLSEEIQLNDTLEAKGIRVVETDLGEYIVQLRGEKPAHLITPAVHLRRDDVARLFHEKLGIPYTEDIPTLTHTARQVLREIFLTAHVGISGVNFGVVETGTLCLVTNEGNGRMITTLPPVHIALMGMERMVRSLDDLALMLSLLARSATTQKLSVYTQLIHAPFPGQQRHLVIVDNGRRRLRNSALKESLYCIRCGACLNSCPVFRELGGHAYHSPYPGPIGSVISAGFFGSEFVPLAQASSLCGACKEACPVDIDLPKLLTRVRAGQAPVVSGQRLVSSHGLSSSGSLFLQIYSYIARSPWRFRLAQKFAALGTRVAALFSNYVRLPAFTGWGFSKDLPRFAGRTFRDRWNVLKEGACDEASTQVDRDRGKEGLGGKGIGELEERSREQLISSFEEELSKVGGHVVHTNQQDLTEHVIDFLHSRGIERVHLQPGILDESALHRVGIVTSHAPDPAIRLGVTGALCGLADTGSILVADGEGSPLQASLLPEIHAAVLCASRILPSLVDAMTLPVVSQSRASVVITGPSRTADIEMSLTIGMHGPGELYVFLIDD